MLMSAYLIAYIPHVDLMVQLWPAFGHKKKSRGGKRAKLVLVQQESHPSQHS